MGKISLDFHFLNEDGDVISTVTFNSLDDIDLCIEKLQEARTEFEHRIEMKKMKAREKRNRRKGRRKNGDVPKEVLDKLREAEEAYNKMSDFLKPVFKPMLDMAKQIVENAKKGADA